MNKITDIKQINTNSIEGRYLFAAIAMLTTSPAVQARKEWDPIDGRDQTPFQMLEYVGELAEKIYKDQPIEETDITKAVKEMRHVFGFYRSAALSGESIRDELDNEMRNKFLFAAESIKGDQPIEKQREPIESQLQGASREIMQQMNMIQKQSRIIEVLAENVSPARFEEIKESVEQTFNAAPMPADHSIWITPEYSKQIIENERIIEILENAGYISAQLLEQARALIAKFPTPCHEPAEGIATHLRRSRVDGLAWNNGISGDKYKDFESDLTILINRHSMESGSNTPDHILARFLMQCLFGLETMIVDRGKVIGNPTIHAI